MTSQAPDISIRHAEWDDAEQLAELYNHYVRTSSITFDIVPVTADDRRHWMRQFSDHGRHQLLVAVRDQTLLGYACSHQFRVKQAYETSVETTIYLDQAATGLGLGSALYTALFETISNTDVHRAYAGITLPNDASMALHKKFGFHPIGVFKEVGFKQNRYWDVQWLEKAVSE